MKTKLIALSAFLALGLTGTASAVPTTGNANFDLSGAFSCDAEGEACNYTALLDFGTGGADADITGIYWNIGIEAVGASWLSEPTIRFDTSPGSIFLTPGAGDDFPGSDFYAGSLVDPDLTDQLGDLFATGGLLNIEIFESFDDAAGQIDAFILEGSFVEFDFNYDDGTSDGGGDDGGDDGTAIPEPGILALLGLGLLGMIGARRRRV